MKDECPGNRKATYFSSSHGQERKERSVEWTTSNLIRRGDEKAFPCG